ncbi:MAG: hypothetical protein KBG30_14475 [Bacteroidales bacterium]|nr:hypothetical protein [Bacteroidales bacterium]
MKKRITMKEKDLVFLPTRKKEKRKATTHLAHCLLPDTQAYASQKSKSQIFPTHQRLSLNKIIVISRFV